MDYPLEEKIGPPELLVGRTAFFDDVRMWIDGIPKKLSKSRVILARRKSGKTAVVQRIFNELWCANGPVIPFYLEITDKNIWYPRFAVRYFRTFASQYISFLERDPACVRTPLELEHIAAYGQSISHPFLASDAQILLKHHQDGDYDFMWELASSAPHRYASGTDNRFLVILDEFQYLTTSIYPDPTYESDPDDTMPGSFHALAESKVAPMLVTGSYMSWIMKISHRFLEAGRLSPRRLLPFLTPEEGLQAVYAYASVYNIPITPDTAAQINEASQSDPFVIACVMQSSCPHRDLTTARGVSETVSYELTDPQSELFLTWATYIHIALDAINDRYAKQLLLFLSKHNDRAWKIPDLQAELKLEMSFDDIRRKLRLMVEADLLEQTSVDMYFRGLQDGTLSIILRHRFEEEINNFVPNIQQEIEDRITALTKDRNRFRGMLNQIQGQVAEYLVAMEIRTRKRFRISDVFTGGSDDAEVNITDVQIRVPLHHPDGKGMELDIVAQSACGRVLLIEVKKRHQRIGVQAITDFHEKVTTYAAQHQDCIIISAYVSLGGFTAEALATCQQYGIAHANQIAWMVGA